MTLIKVLFFTVLYPYHLRTLGKRVSFSFRHRPAPCLPRALPRWRRERTAMLPTSNTKIGQIQPVEPQPKKKKEPRNLDDSFFREHRENAAATLAAETRFPPVLTLTLRAISAMQHAHEAEVRLYDRLFAVEDPNREEDGKTYLDHLNPHSLEVIRDARLEPGLAKAVPGVRFQFERLGYFCTDAVDSQPGRPVFNRTVTLRDAWARQQKKG